MVATLHPFSKNDVLRYPHSQQLVDSQKTPRTSLSYALPTATTRRVLERYSLDEGTDSNKPDLSLSLSSSLPQSALATPPQDAPSSFLDSGRSYPNQADVVHDVHRHTGKIPEIISNTRPSYPPIFTATKFASIEPLPVGSLSPIMSLTASPTYSPPVAPRHRTYPQQPTYIIPPANPNPVDTVFPLPPQQQQEEVCVECAMRDQEMADVDVTSPGIWDRESDALYEELKQREIEEEARGSTSVDPSRPRARGGRLTEQNLKQWLALNPRETALKQQTLHAYIKVQRTLLEAEALAQAQAMQEAKQFDSKMREAYSQLRQSTYDLTVGADDTGGLRIRQPTSPISALRNSRHTRSHSRDVTLLENGIIVEHVDVRREEREERERRKKEEKRARKLSRSSVLDITSTISVPSNGQHDYNGLGYPSQSFSSSMRPNSILTAPSDRPDIPTAYSQASFSDVHSVSSITTRRSKFLGFRSLTPGWRSRDSLAPSGISGSMIDMHLALHREPNALSVQPSDANPPRRSQIWANTEFENAGKQEKKKNGLARIWRLVTGSNKGSAQESPELSRPNDKVEDDFPLAPPPPLSYLVDRCNGDLLMTNGRQSSTSSLPSMASLRPGGNPAGMSPPTPPSSVLPSPVSSRPYAVDMDTVEVRINYDDQEVQRQDEIHGKYKPFGIRKVYPATSEPDIRNQVVSNTPPPVPSLPPLLQNQPPPPLLREKSLPPLPGDPVSPCSLVTPSETRPRTVYSDDPRATKLSFFHPSASFRTFDVRRQSFGGMTSRPNIQTVPIKPPDPRRSFGLRYDEFGDSRRSLGRLEQKTPIQTSAKKKSKFLSSLLGSKHNRDLQPPQEPTSDTLQQFPPMRSSGSDGQHDAGITGYATSTSRHSALSMGALPRSHRISTKALEELVTQDPEFVAYRYPSKEQHLELLR